MTIDSESRKAEITTLNSQINILENTVKVGTYFFKTILDIIAPKKKRVIIILLNDMLAIK